MQQTEFDREVDRNFEAFVMSRDSFLQNHRGQFALMKDGEVVDFHPDERAALAAGRARYHDRPFSIQEVTDRPVDLGFFSHAINTRIA